MAQNIQTPTNPSLSHSPHLDYEENPGSSLVDMSLNFFYGSLGGVANVISGHPLDTLKVRIQILNMKLSSCVKYMVKNEGPKALYKGVTSPLFNVPLIYAVDFGVYEISKRIQGVRPKDEMTVYQSLIAGAWAGFAVCAVMTPVELIKCQLQMQGAGRKVKTMTAFGLTKEIVKSQGIRALYKGNLITILREVPAGAAYFGGYDYAKKKLKSEYGNKNWVTFLAGGIGGLLSWIISYPQDVIKTKIQCDSGVNKKYPQNKLIKDGGIISCAKDIWKNQGIRGFGKGFSACALRAVIAEAATFFVYENMKEFSEH